MSYSQNGRRQAGKQERAEHFMSVLADRAPAGKWLVMPKREICELLGCSRNTAERMIALLLAQGRIERDYAYDPNEPAALIGLKFRLPAVRKAG